MFVTSLFLIHLLNTEDVTINKTNVFMGWMLIVLFLLGAMGPPLFGIFSSNHLTSISSAEIRSKASALQNC